MSQAEKLSRNIRVEFNGEKDHHWICLGKYIKFGFTDITRDFYDITESHLPESMKTLIIDKALQILNEPDNRTLFLANGVSAPAAEVKRDLFELIADTAAESI